MLAKLWMMSRFRDESNSLIPHREPIDEGEARGDGDHEELLTMHAGNQDRAKSKREHGEENSARKAESIGERIFLTQHRQSGGDRAVDEKAGDAGEQRVPAKIACDGKYQKQHGKNHDRDMRGSKTGMDAAEESREIAALAHGKSDTRGVQDVGAEISVR